MGGAMSFTSMPTKSVGNGGPRYFQRIRKSRSNHSASGNLLWFGFWLGVTILYAFSFIGVWYFFRKYSEESSNPSTNVRFENLDQKLPVRFPAVRLCSMTNERVIDTVTCKYRDLDRDIEENCEFVAEYGANIPQEKGAVCFRFNEEGEFDAFVASSRSSLEIAVRVHAPEFQPQGAEQNSYISNPFRDALAVKALIYDVKSYEYENERAGFADTASDRLGGIGGRRRHLLQQQQQPQSSRRENNLDYNTTHAGENSQIFPAGMLTTVALDKKAALFKITKSPPRVTFAAAIAHAPIGHSTPGSILIDDIGRRVDETVYLQVFFNSLTIQTTIEEIGYDWFNAFSDSAAVAGFLCGASIFNGPSYSSWIWMDFMGRKQFLAT